MYTEEEVKIPDSVLAFISIKAKAKWKGLINVSGFHVDPGFHGRLKFSVYNAGTDSLAYEYGSELFLIWFADLDAHTRDPYDGKHGNQNRLTAEDYLLMQRQTASPASLDERLKKLEGERQALLTVFWLLIVPIIVGVVIFVLQHLFETFAKGNKSTLPQTTLQVAPSIVATPLQVPVIHSGGNNGASAASQLTSPSVPTTVKPIASPHP